MAPVAIAGAVAWTLAGGAAAVAGQASPNRPADQARNDQWWLREMHVTQAWRTTKGAGVTVALLDTGVDPGQPDLAGSVMSGPDLTNSGRHLGGPYFGVHGTAMASLIAGHGPGPGRVGGISGIAPQATILSVRVVLDSGDPLLADSGVASRLPGAIAAGIRYAADNGAQIIDLPLDPGQPGATGTGIGPAAASLGGTGPSAGATAAAGGSVAERSAVNYALRKGVVLVAPAGDNGAASAAGTATDAVNYPAAYPGVISVGAVGEGLARPGYSSRQSYVTLTAAGDGVTAAVPPHGYATVHSTSAASAVVTGIAALIRAQFPELTPRQVTEALTRGVLHQSQGGAGAGSGHGIADAARALAAAAAIAGPGARRAGAAAADRVLSAPPSATGAGGSSLSSRLERDGAESGALLVVLLLLILAYAMVRRPRAGPAAPAPAGLSARGTAGPAARRTAGPAARGTAGPTARGTAGPTARGTAGPTARGTAGPDAAPESATGADQMLEYFAMPAQPGGYPDATSRAGGRRASAAPSLGGSAALFGPPTSGVGGQIGRVPADPASRGNFRPPKVSGSPPWEPAPKPDGVVPWATSAAPLLPGGPQPAPGDRSQPAPGAGQPAPGDRSQPAPGAGQPAPGRHAQPAPGGPQSEAGDPPDIPTFLPAAPGHSWNPPARHARAHPPDEGAPPGTPPGGAAAQPARVPAPGGGHTGDRPNFAWNPAASTETFPAASTETFPAASTETFPAASTETFPAASTETFPAVGDEEA